MTIVVFTTIFLFFYIKGKVLYFNFYFMGLLLFLCFPVKGIVVMFVAALLAAAVPLPRCIKPQQVANCDEEFLGAGGGTKDSSSGLLGGATKFSSKEESKHD